MSFIQGDYIGPYQVLQEIGKGGMATVYKVSDPKTRQELALKLLSPQSMKDLQIRKRFKREFIVLRHLSDRHIVQTYEFNQVKEPLTYFYTMEYIPDPTLKELLDQNIRFEIFEACAIISGVAKAISSAHQKNIVHRDIKPGNIFVSHKGVKVADFGIASLVTEKPEERLTQVGLKIGTAKYMSPEQASGTLVDYRSDIYSLGILFYEILAGHPPFDDENPYKTIKMQVMDTPPDLRQFRSDVPESLWQIILKCLNKDPLKRYEHISLLAADLDVFIDPALEQIASKKKQFLVLLSGPNKGTRIPLESDLVLGRQSIIFDAALTRDPKISREHVKLTRLNHSYFIEDLESSNGTYLNKQRILPYTKYSLKHKDIFMLGKVFIGFGEV